MPQRSPLQPLGRIDSSATVVVVVVLALAVAGIDLVSGGAVRGPVLFVVPVAVATWRAGRRAGLTVVVLTTLPTVVVDLRDGLQPFEVAGRAIDLLTLSIVVGAVAAMCDHLRRHWRKDLLDPTVVSGGGLAGRLELELDRLVTTASSLVLACVRLESSDSEPARAVPAMDAVLDAFRGTIRDADLVARVGDQLWLLMPDTDGAGARLALDRHQARIVELGHAAGIALRVSAGAAIFHKPLPPALALVKARDALGLAERVGRERIVVVERRNGG